MNYNTEELKHFRFIKKINIYLRFIYWKRNHTYNCFILMTTIYSQIITCL